jgi:hypothetical protein
MSASSVAVSTGEPALAVGAVVSGASTAAVIVPATEACISVAGTPSAVAPAGTSQSTSVLAAIVAPAPMRKSGRMLAFEPTYTPSSSTTRALMTALGATTQPWPTWER